MPSCRSLFVTLAILALTFQDEAQAQIAALLPGAEVLANPAVVQVRAHDFALPGCPIEREVRR